MRKLLYRVAPHNGGVIFAEPRRAVLVARVHRAIETARTWGEFRKEMPRKEYSAVLRQAFDEMGERRPRSTDAFTSESVPGYSDGDYPPWLQQEMGGLLPAELLERFAVREDTRLNGSYWFIPEHNLAAVCDALRAQGWKLREAQDLEFS